MQYIYIKNNYNECFMGILDVNKDNGDNYDVDYSELIEEELDGNDFDNSGGYVSDDMEDSIGLRHMEDDLPTSLKRLDRDDEDIFDDEGLGEEKLMSIYAVTSHGIDYDDPVIRYLNEDSYSIYAEMELDFSVERISSDSLEGRDSRTIFKSLPIGTYTVLEKKL